MKTNIYSSLTILVFFLTLIFNINNGFGQTTLILQPNSIDGKDANINSNFPTINAGTNQGLYSAGWTWSGDYGTVRSFFQFDLTSIPTNATIASAKLSLYNDPVNNSFLTNGEHSNLTASNASFISQVTEAWEETNINWNNQPNYDTINQVTLQESTYPNQEYLDVNVIEIVQNMVNDPSSNHGFVLRLQTEINYAALIFASSDNIDSTNHPKLEVVYSIPTAVNDQLQDELTINSYPNPTQDKIYIDLSVLQSNLTLTLFNNLGQISLIKNYESTNKIEVNLDIPNGIYFIRIQTPIEVLKTIKILKK